MAEEAQTVIQEIPTKASEEKSPTPSAMQPISAASASQSLRVNSTKIDLIIDTISEMVITNAKISNLVQQYDNTELEEASVFSG